jgi:hypothetical protein
MTRHVESVITYISPTRRRRRRMKFIDVWEATSTNGEYNGNGENLAAVLDFLVKAEDMSTKESDAMRIGFTLGVMYTLAKVRAGKIDEAAKELLSGLSDLEQELDP